MTATRVVAGFVLCCGVLPAEEPAPEADLQQRARGVRWVSLALREQRPEDLSVSLRPGHQQPRFAGFVYGTPESRRVAVIVAQTASGELALYVDGRRNRSVTERNLVSGSGDLRLLRLNAEQVIDDVAHPYPREVLFQLPREGGPLRIATLTTPEHDVRPDDDAAVGALRVRQADGNANGLFSDPRDLLLIDLDGDERFDPFLEAFPFRPVLESGGRRWFVHADQFGQRVQLHSATATGRLQLSTRVPDAGARVAELIFTVEGEDGSVFSLTGPSAVTDLPVGRYAASVLFAAIQPAGEERRWEYTFSHNAHPAGRLWIDIREGETTTLDPIGELTLDAVAKSRPTESATVLEIQPRLWTGTRLLVNSVQLSDVSSYSGPQCRTTVVNAEGRSLGSAQSGFA
jgi:hypothetical protein